MSDRRDLTTADAIDRYWDTVFAGRSLENVSLELDDGLAATIRRLHEIDVPNTVSRAENARRWTDLLSAVPDPFGSSADGAPIGFEPRTREVGTTRTPLLPETGRRFGFARFHATTALFALMLIAIVYLSFKSGMLEGTHRGAAIPTATPTAAPAAKQSVLTITIPAESIPTSVGGLASFQQFEIPPGDQQVWTGCCDGPAVLYLLSGTLNVHAQQEVQIVTASSHDKPVTVAPQVDIVLNSGDTLIFDLRTSYLTTNSAPNSAHLLFWTLDAAGGLESHAPSSWMLRDQDLHASMPEFAPVAVSLRLERIELASGARYVVPTSAPDEFAFALGFGLEEDGTTKRENLATDLDGSLFNQGDETATVYLLTIAPSSACGRITSVQCDIYTRALERAASAEAGTPLATPQP